MYGNTLEHDFYPYTLGYQSNPIFSKYMPQYESKLVYFGRKYVSEEFLNDVFSLNFLKIPDIASNLQACEQEKNNREMITFLESEWLLYKQHGIGSLKSKQGSYIPGTKILLTPNDYNPSAKSAKGHPDHDNNELSGFGDVSEEEWLVLYEKVFSLLRSISPGFADELDVMIQKIVPYGVSYQKHCSASHSNCIGHLYMSYPTGYKSPELAVLEAIIHESNHNKIHLIQHTDALILSPNEEIYYSPYRPDSRHISGIYLGLHAMAGVFYTFFQGIKNGSVKMDEGFMIKSLSYVLKNQASIRVLEKYGRYTTLGKEILEEMMLVHKTTLGFIKDIGFPKVLITKASENCQQHFLEAQKRNPIILY